MLPSPSPSAPSAATSSRPGNPAPRFAAPAAKATAVGPSPASRPGGSPGLSHDESGDDAPQRKRGRGLDRAEPPAARPVVNARDALSRLLKIHDILSERRRKAPTAEDLAKAVSTSERNVKRDIATMRHSLRLPIGTHRGCGGGYYYTRPNVEFGGSAATPSELTALAVAAQMARAYAGTRLEEDVLGALRRLRLDARAEEALDLDHIADVLSFRGLGFDLPADRGLFERLTLAALRREELSFSYRGTADLAWRKRTVEPWRVFCEENAWYLRAWDPAAEGFRHFCLGLLKRVQATGRRFTRTPRQRKEDASFDDSLGAFGGGPLVRVVLRFRDGAARAIRRLSWHKSQQVRVLGPRETELELRVADNPSLLRFVLRWGQDVRVLEPASLREAVLANARALLAQG